MFRRLADSVYSVRPDRFTAAAVVAGFLVAAVASGTAIASQNVVLIALMGGTVLSAVLLSAPSVAVWIVLVGTLVVAGPLMFYVRAMDRLPWLFSVLGIFLAFAALLYGGLMRRGRRGPVPTFVLLGVVFVLYVMASMLWAQGPLSETGPGARRTVHYWGLMLALALIAFPDRTIGRWMLFFVVLGLVQAPYAIYQRVVVHPTLQHNYVFDSIAGTLEVAWNGLGGASGVLAFMQIVLVGAMCAAYRDRLIGATTLGITLLVLMIPVAVGEVNVVFIWLPLAVASVFIDQIRRRPAVFMGGAALVGALMAGLGIVYLAVQQAQGTGPSQTLEQRVRELYEYNLGSRGYINATDVNRLTVIPYWAKNNGLHNPVQATFGHGVGASFGSADVRTQLRTSHGERSIDLVTVSAFLWDLGIVGAGLYLAVIGFAWRSAYRLTEIARAGIDRVIARSLFCGTTLLFSLGFYNNAIVTTASQQVIAMMLLGITAWMERRYTASNPPAREARVGAGTATSGLGEPVAAASRGWR